MSVEVFPVLRAEQISESMKVVSKVMNACRQAYQQCRIRLYDE